MGKELPNQWINFGKKDGLLNTVNSNRVVEYSFYSVQRSSILDDYEIVKSSKHSYEFNEKRFPIPNELKSIIPLLKKAERILDLPENWDDAGGKPISRDTFASMAFFLIKYAKYIYDNFAHVIALPSIYPSLEGSIDLDWEKENYGLLINIADKGSYASYYADNKKKNRCSKEVLIRSILM